ncbi:hypothetical protein P7C71_g2850, partial [Lecanoromycetidae sp. Uapishka_2]
MRAAAMVPSSILAILILAPSLTAAITLSTFQPISGFSDTCNNAYNTPLNGCTASDFSTGDCSMSCISFLDALTKVLNADCTGTSAYPNTLIAAFFNSQGTQTLCPNVLSGDNSGSGNSGASSAATSVPAVLGHQGGEASVATYATLSFSAVPPTTSSDSTTSASSSSSSAVEASDTNGPAATTTKTTFAKTTVMPEATQPINPSLSLSTSTSSTSASTPKSSGNNGGGGTILDVGSNSARQNTRIGVWVLFLLTGSVGLLVLL